MCFFANSYSLAYLKTKQQLKFPGILFTLDAFCAFADLGQRDVVMGLELVPHTFFSYAHGSKDSTDLIYTPHNIFWVGNMLHMVKEQLS